MWWRVGEGYLQSATRSLLSSFIPPFLMVSADFWRVLPALDGPQLIVALVVLAMVMGFFAARFFFASGKDKLVAQQAEKQDAISVLQGQIARLEAEKGEAKVLLERQIGELKIEVAGLKQEVRRMSENEEFNRDYRHALANRANLLQFAYDVAYEFLMRVLQETEGVPDYLRREVSNVKPTAELLKSAPLPGREGGRMKAEG